jgi:site-specific recombinase XerD
LISINQRGSIALRQSLHGAPWINVDRDGSALINMLRHACGFALADQGADTRLIQDYLGHRNIQHTLRYTATNPASFEKLWR